MKGVFPNRRGRPIKKLDILNTSQEGTLEGETRATFIVKEESLEAVKALALLEKRKIKDVVNDAFNALFGLKGNEYLQEALNKYGTDRKENGSSGN